MLNLKKEYDSFIVEKNELLQVVDKVKNKLNFSILLDITCIDYLNYVEEKQSRFALIYLFRSSDFKQTLSLKVYVHDEIESLNELYKSANWAEREVYDQYGIKFTNHPNLKRILNHQDFIGHPLRKDYEITKRQILRQSDDLMSEMRKGLFKKGIKDIDDFMFLNLGPAHPASHGTIRIFAALDGEYIVNSVLEIGYLHRGFEKSCENHTYNQIIPYTDRLNYCSAILNNISFCYVVEKMLDIQIPDRAKFIRVIIGELSRIIDHLVFLAAIANDMGAITNYFYLINARERVYLLLSRLSGARLTNSYTRIGGLAYDLHDNFNEDIKECIKQIQEGVGDTLKMLEHNKIFHQRTQNIGIISKEDAISFGLSGPNLRACGIEQDLRKTNPYYFYESFDFDIAVGSVGDIYDRIMVRFVEIDESIKIINQAIKTIPKGNICVDNHKISLPSKQNVYNNIEGLMNQFKLIYEGIKVPKNEFYASIEAGNGELGFFIVSDGSGTPYKVKVRPPCFYGLNALSKIIQGNLVADAILALGSLNAIAGELDR